MQKQRKRALLLEQLEDRIFLDANPVAGALDAPGADLPDHVSPPDPVTPDLSHQADTDLVAQDNQLPEAMPSLAADSADADTTPAHDDSPHEPGVADSGDEPREQAEADEGSGPAGAVGADPDTVASSSASGLQDQGQDAMDNDQATSSLSSDASIPPGQAIDPMIGEDFNFTVTFDNTTTSTVYGPYIDILLDGGQDGADAPVDGITFQDATYLGVQVQSQVIDITSDGQAVDHPWATDSNGDPLQVTGINGHTFQAGDQFVSLRMPFGSFETDQPAAEVTVTAHMSENADVGAGNDLAVEVTTGAMYGHDALDNPATDAPLRDIATSSLTFAPEVIAYNADIEVSGVHGDCQEQHAADHDTRYRADDPGQVFESNHQEIPTGPNYPGTYVIRVDIADGQSVDNLALTEHLPDNIVFLGNVSVTDSGGNALAYQAIQNGTDLQISLDNSITGTSSATDVTIRYDFYIPEQTTAGQPVIDPQTGDDVHIVNNGELSYTWSPIDSNDPGPVTGVINAEVDRDGHFSGSPDIDDISHAQSLAIQKDHVLSTDTGAPGYSPGDTVAFSLDFQVSDFFSFGDHDPSDTDYSFRIDDLVPDGLTMENNGTDYLASIDIWQGGSLYHLDLTSTSTAGDMMWVTTDADNNLEVHYNLEEIFATMDPASGGILRGDLTDGNQDGPTHGRITYSADIARVYHDENNSGNGGTDNDLDQGDILSGAPTITGEIYANGAFTGQAEGDASCDSLQIVTGSVDKDIYAVNGQTGVGGTPHISPGDTVTYRLYYDMPLSSTEDFHLVDYLPLPVFDVNDPDQDGTASGWSQVADGTLPGAGEWAFTANDSYHTLNTTMDGVGPGTGNSLVFDWAPYHDASGTSSTVEILFTVTVSGEPFADGMYLTNQVRATEQGTTLADNTTDAIVQVILDQPELTITKGVVETDNDAAVFPGNAFVDSYFTEPGSSGFRAEPGTVISTDWLAGHNIDTDLRGIDAGDLVTFAIVVQNTGHSGAFDIRLTDDMPTGFATPASGLNLSVTDGAGNALAYSGDLFTGLELTDDADGALAPTDPASGADVLVITYDLVATTNVAPFQNLVNTATLTNYAGTEGGTDHTVTDPTDSARVTTASARPDKVLVTTNQAHTGGNDVAIGEQAEYAITLTIPEGTLYSARLTDTMTDNSAGVEMAVVSLDSITASSSLTAANGSFDDILNNATIDADGGGFTLDFGDLVNSDTDNSVTETITVHFTGVVLNNPDLDRSETVNDQARLIWVDGNSIAHSQVDSGPDLTVVEPTLQVSKTVDSPHPDQDDTITFTMVIEHDGTSNADAFDAYLSDTIPAGLTYVPGSLANTGGLAPDSLAINGDVISASWGTFAQGQSSTITFQAHLDTAQAGQDLSNTADIDWSGLPGDVTAPQSSHNSLSTERTGDTADPGGAANDYRAASTASVTVIADIDKLEPAPATYTIGEQVTYDIRLTLPEGDTGGLVVTDALPDGMVYVSHTVETSSFSGTLNSPTVDSTAGDGNDITFDFGDVQVTADNDPTNNGFTIQVTVQVLDQPGNYQGVTLTNHASMTFDDPDNPGQRLTDNDPTDPTVTVVEPQITTHKSVTDSADPGTDASPGEILTYTVRFSNTGDATAYEVHADDILPAGVQFNPGSESAVDQDGAAVPVTVTDNGAGNLAIAGDWDIGVDDWVQVQYTVTVLGAGFTAGPHENTVDADWSSMDGSQPGERSYTDSGNSPVDGDQDTDTASFTVVTDASLGDTVFFDADNSGGFSSGDVGISGVNVTITADVDNDGTPEFTRTVTTDADGAYLFDNLAAFANYTVSVDYDGSGGSALDLQAAGYHQTYDLDEDGSPALDHTARGIGLAAGQERTDVDFGYTGQNAVGDTIWFDVNADGVQDPGEDGIGGLSVSLSADIDGDGIFEYTATTTTDGSGVYGFDNLPAGDFVITVTPPGGTEATYDQDSGTTAPDNSTPFSLAADQDRDDIDFGLRGTGTIGDFIWYDADGNGAQNEGTHAGIGGVIVTLAGDIDGDGSIDYSTNTITAADGSYSFGHLLGGDYTVHVDTASLPVAMVASGDPDGTLDNTATVHLADGASDLDQDFGYTGTGSIGDRVWYDRDGDGVQDPDENGLAGVGVSITADIDGDGINEYSQAMVTDANGNYTFDHLAAADYTVLIDTATLPGGATPTYDLDSATNLPDNQATYTLATGENMDRVDFGYTGSGTIGDLVWNDSNGNGVQDAGEQGFAGVTVTLTGDLDGDGVAAETITTTTDADGNYRFDNLFLGDYTVSIDPATLPAGTSPTWDYDDHGQPVATPHTADVSLTAADPDRSDVDFGYNSRGTIGDTVWYDMDGDGIQDSGESGLAGVTVTLSGDTDGDGVADVTRTTTTDAGGNYLFDQLMAGDYTITLSNLPGGLAQTADPDGTMDNAAHLTLADGETNLDQDFGYTGTGAIGDTVWNDADGNGSQDPGEQGLAGVTVTLTGDLNNDGIIDTLTTVTDGSGNYHFERLPEGPYTVSVDTTTLPPGMVVTADPDGGNDASATLTLGPGETNNDQDFGFRQTGTIGDTVWFDANGNGLLESGESGLAGVTVTLSGDTDGDGVADVTLTTTTDASGSYLFDQLTAGDYTVTLSGLPGGLAQTADPDGAMDNAAHLTLAGGETNLDQDFGYTGTGAIGDTIWNDADGNGSQDPGEQGLAGVTVTLTGDLNNDGIIDTLTTVTDGNGNYHFDRLPEGPYTVSVDTTTLPPGMVVTADPDGGSDASATLTLGPGETNNDQDFGFRQTGTIGDTVWYDMDGDGIRDPGEPGLANVNLTLVGDLDNDGQADDTLTTVTDADGNYHFDRLPAGTYVISVDTATLPAGMRQTFDADGTATGNSSTVTIGDGGVDLDQDFGYTGTGSIGDTIWYDADGNASQDGTEPGIAGVRVTLTGDLDNDGQADDTITVTTDADGTYLFPNLPAGTFDITVDTTTLPAGMAGSGDPDTVIDNATTLALAPGQDNLDQDFGYTGTGSIGDQLWIDGNGNGTMDPGEQGLAGVQVCIGVDLDGDGQADYRATTTTGADGTYLFDNLPAGSHTVCVNPATLPPGIRPGFDPDGNSDNSTVVHLGAGEQNRSTDFGYTFPPVPHITPVGPTPRPVTPTPTVPAAEAALPTGDSLLMYQQFVEQAREPLFQPLVEIPWPPPMVPISPMYTGHAEPGTTLFLTLFDAQGIEIGYQTVMGDAAGNWLASFPGSLLYDIPHHLRIEQTISSYNASSAGLFNLRTYFNPDFSAMVFSTTPLSVDAVFSELPGSLMESIHESNLSSFSLRWNGYRDYEFLSPSINPSNLSH